MIDHGNNLLQVEPTDSLPNLVGARTIYIDFETTSMDPARDSLNPWIKQHCQIAGIAITVDKLPQAFYIPLRHWCTDGTWHTKNCDIESAMRWLRDLVAGCEYWVNHNVKYEAHVAYNSDIEPIDVLQYGCALLCTLTKAKVFNSDMAYRGGYGLDNLAKAWLGVDISAHEQAMQPWLSGLKIDKKQNRDYGLIPPDIIAPYACTDVHIARQLDAYLSERMPERSLGVCDTELELTRILIEMERTGLPVSLDDVRKDALQSFARFIMLAQQICDVTGFREFRPHVTDDCYKLFCNRWGLPVLAYTDGEDVDDMRLSETDRNASFSKHVLPQYADLPYISDQQRGIIAAIIDYRRLNTRLNIFLAPYQEILGQTGESVIHPTYNQCVRTGRMGCSEPNMMQLDGQTKALIKPPEGWAIVSADASQLEYRVIVHYINDKLAIEQYNENPDADFHQLIADMCHVSRKAGKVLNLAAGYGMGKKKTIKLLSGNRDVAQEIYDQITAMGVPQEQRQAAFKLLAEQRGAKMLERYHDMLPTLKTTSREALRRCKTRGYVFNGYGRMRYIPSQYAHIAFNSICQSHAADYVKERMVALHHAIKASGLPVYLAAQVHDSLCLLAPADLAQEEAFQRDIVRILESPAKPLRVPLRWNIAASTLNWKHADTPIKDGGPSRTLQGVKEFDPVYLKG